MTGVQTCALPIYPLAAIHVAVNRLAAPGHEEGDYEAFLPEQAIDLGTSLTAYTAGSAFVNHLDETGTVEVGRLADLVVLDRDPFAGPPAEIGATRVLQTFVEGERVSAASDASRSLTDAVAACTRDIRVRGAAPRGPARRATSQCRRGSPPRVSRGRD